MPKPQEPGKPDNKGKPDHAGRPDKEKPPEAGSKLVRIDGTDGNDKLASDGAGNGPVILAGGKGDDHYVLTMERFGPGDFRIVENRNGGKDVLELIGGDAHFKLPDNVENLLAAKAGKVHVTGNDLDNRMEAGSGASRLDGGGGNDVLVGGAANDVLIGGAGSDQLTGGAGADKFIFQKARGPLQNDVITDFNFAAGDRIVLHGPHSYTVSSSSGGNALLTVFDGSTIELVGVKAADVAAGWFTQG